MRFLLLFFILFQLIVLGSSDFPIMMELKSDEKISDDFRMGVEDALTSQNYSLISLEDQERALKEQSEIRKKGCYDDECLVDTGKMLAAKGVIIVDVTKRDNNLYVFRMRLINLEKGVIEKTASEYFKNSLNHYEELNNLGQKLISKLFNLDSKKTLEDGANDLSESETNDSSDKKNIKENMVNIPSGYFIPETSNYSDYSSNYIIK
ncbi:hypothetical protein JXR93_09620 [bacterium]|nr:hypothetical protein [bacterium]